MIIRFEVCFLGEKMPEITQKNLFRRIYGVVNLFMSTILFKILPTHFLVETARVANL